MFTSTITVFILVPVFFDPMKKRALQTGAGIPAGSMNVMGIYQQLASLLWLHYAGLEKSCNLLARFHLRLPRF
jgi:hypothetical protein